PCAGSERAGSRPARRRSSHCPPSLRPAFAQTRAGSDFAARRSRFLDPVAWAPDLPSEVSVTRLSHGAVPHGLVYFSLRHSGAEKLAPKQHGGHGGTENHGVPTGRNFRSTLTHGDGKNGNGQF